MEFYKKNKQTRLAVFEAEDHISFITNKVNATKHTHYYIQMTFGINQNFDLEVENTKEELRGIIIDSNVPHVLNGNNSWQYYMLINPESNFGLEIKKLFLSESSIYKLDFSLIESITHLFTNIECSNSYLTFIRQIMHMLRIINRINLSLYYKCVVIIYFFY